MDWEPIDENTPKGQDVLIWDGNYVEMASFDGKWWWVNGDFTVNPTHWQPLPSPPESKET